MENEESTTRERILTLLYKASKPLSVEEIISLLGLEDLTPRDVYEHLEHIARTVKARSKGREYLGMEPPYCRKCGYVFKDLDKPKKPSRCPRCKSEWISPPLFTILRKD
ncbi:transcriptional regulator [Thermosphaera chiliense]|uniref:Transcriptional regulator n=1 Tax=Thermosphaera chiliense TaxID=3402707 RepID=A0A7M1URP9_9CREN|nr:transcriptional regulator [Thermosphaera aggregans]QOR94948.1 transcriptional regulator [Thermosphaera aggregans]